MILSRSAIFNLFLVQGQKPRYVVGLDTLIDTKSAGMFYILEYNGTGRVGWTLSDSVLRALKSHAKWSVLLINSKDGEMFVFSHLSNNCNDDAALNTILQGKSNPYKIDRCEVEDCSISYENFDYYLCSL